MPQNGSAGASTMVWPNPGLMAARLLARPVWGLQSSKLLYTKEQPVSTKPSASEPCIQKDWEEVLRRKLFWLEGFAAALGHKELRGWVDGFRRDLNRMAKGEIPDLRRSSQKEEPE